MAFTRMVFRLLCRLAPVQAVGWLVTVHLDWAIKVPETEARPATAAAAAVVAVVAPQLAGAAAAAVAAEVAAPRIRAPPKLGDLSEVIEGILEEEAARAESSNEPSRTAAPVGGIANLRLVPSHSFNQCRQDYPHRRDVIGCRRDWRAPARLTRPGAGA